jgi:hypothetical protein
LQEELPTEYAWLKVGDLVTTDMEADLVMGGSSLAELFGMGFVEPAVNATPSETAPGFRADTEASGKPTKTAKAKAKTRLVKRACKKMQPNGQMEAVIAEYVFTQTGVDALKEESTEHYVKVGSPSLGDPLTPEIQAILAEDDVTLEALLEMGFVKLHRSGTKTLRFAQEDSVTEFVRHSSAPKAVVNARTLIFTKVGIQSLRESAADDYDDIGRPDVGDFVRPEIGQALAEAGATLEDMLEMGYVEEFRGACTVEPEGLDPAITPLANALE